MAVIKVRKKSEHTKCNRFEAQQKELAKSERIKARISANVRSLRFLSPTQLSLRRLSR